MALPDTFDKLKELLTQDQFELLLDEEKKEAQSPFWYWTVKR